jgi:hypothetical protein
VFYSNTLALALIVSVTVLMVGTGLFLVQLRRSEASIVEGLRLRWTTISSSLSMVLGVVSIIIIFFWFDQDLFCYVGEPIYLRAAFILFGLQLVTFLSAVIGSGLIKFK